MQACDPARARTVDPLIKSQLLYQLSYGVKIGIANIVGFWQIPILGILLKKWKVDV
jgi:hypothetical protein